MKLLITGGSGFIGTNLVDYARSISNVEILNLDIKEPSKRDQKSFWKAADIMDCEVMLEKVREFEPTHVIHLAARTDCDELTTVDTGYAVNTVGTENLLEALKQVSSLEQLVVFSTQFVCGPGVTPESTWHYQPHTVYGESKCQMEKIVRAAEIPYSWFFVRPVNIWGPWHMRYREEFWRVVESGHYFHPSGFPIIRTYGYVENVIWQVFQLLEADNSLTGGKAFYVGDDPCDIYEWTNAFSMALANKPARKVPRSLLYLVGAFGSALARIGISFPLTLSRFASMTTDYPTSIDKTHELVGKPPHTLKDGVQTTVQWLHSMNS